MLDSIVGAHFLKLAENEYCSKIEKNSGFRSYTLQTYLILQSFPWAFEFKVILRLSPEQIQTSGIFRTRGILRTLSIYPV